MKSVKLASILFYLNSVFVVSCFVSCGSSPTEASSLLTADIRGGMDKPGLLELGDEIKGVTFVPLEVTTDDASLIDGVYDYAVTDRYIYVLPVKEPRIVLFDRQGRFIRTLVKEGRGRVNLAVFCHVSKWTNVMIAFFYLVIIEFGNIR
mgnify:FL=1